MIRAIDRCGTLAQNDGSIAVGVIIDGKAERIAEIAQLEIVAAVDVVLVTICINAVDRQVLQRDRYVRGGGVRCGNANQEQRQNDGQ